MAAHILVFLMRPLGDSAPVGATLVHRHFSQSRHMITFELHPLRNCVAPTHSNHQPGLVASNLMVLLLLALMVGQVHQAIARQVLVEVIQGGVPMLGLIMVHPLRLEDDVELARSAKR
eukprot:CAMPEP_0204005282 /NCGR_PEP_ID=MMETSP0360-20130528/18967_1 /ASSEMBLY_ACC=CAM_ASM_000342 /TAXON_ID=268821 /ORGANISM="Scrippsiella Hangoei, Strain SHTV-5" /LENGTH=117 /DNA_ID=CAMNT_0050947249 /DNA_START=8 /DNA_END=361 /DNA_ORIENTATION=+